MRLFYSEGVLVWVFITSRPQACEIVKADRKLKLLDLEAMQPLLNLMMIVDVFQVKKKSPSTVIHLCQLFVAIVV